MLCLGHVLRAIHRSRERIWTGAHRKATARSAHAHRPQCAAASSTSGAYAVGRCLVSGLRLLCVTPILVGLYYFLSKFCSSMGSPQRIKFNNLHPLIADEWAHCAPLMDAKLNGSLWWLPFICFQQGGTAMDLRHRITAPALLYSSPCPVVDNLKPKPETRSKLSLIS